MNLPIMKEKIATPKRSIMEHTSLSTLVFGTKSPKPQVDRDVIAKYTEIIQTLAGLIRCKL